MAKRKTLYVCQESLPGVPKWQQMSRLWSMEYSS